MNWRDRSPTRGIVARTQEFNTTSTRTAALWTGGRLDPDVRTTEARRIGGRVRSICTSRAAATWIADGSSRKRAALRPSCARRSKSAGHSSNRLDNPDARATVPKHVVCSESAQRVPIQLGRRIRITTPAHSLVAAIAWSVRHDPMSGCASGSSTIHRRTPIMTNANHDERQP